MVVFNTQYLEVPQVSRMSHVDGRVRYRMSVLVPIWSVQLFFLSIYVIELGLLIGIIRNSPISKTDVSDRSPGLQVWNIVDLGLAIVGLLLTCSEIVIQTQRSLHPTFYLWSNIVKTVMWIATIALSIWAKGSTWATLDKYNPYYLYLIIGTGTAVLIPTVASLIYAIVVYKRYQRRVYRLAKDYI